MKKYFILISCLFFLQNFSVGAVSHGIVFEEEASLVEHYPCLKGVTLNPLPFNDTDFMEVTEDNIKNCNLIVENEYAVNNTEKKLVTTGIYDCVGIVFPNLNMMMHIHKKTNLDSLQDVIKNFSNEDVYLYTSHISSNLIRVLEKLIQIGFNKESIILSFKPMVIGEFESAMAYTYSYDDISKGLSKSCYMPQKLSFYVSENESVKVKSSFLECLMQHLKSKSFNFLGAMSNFFNVMNSPLNISLKDNKVDFFKINYDLMRSYQDINNRNSLSHQNIVCVDFFE